jgi:hypothetical protein
LLINRYKKRHGIFPMLASMFGGCGERSLDDLLGAWLHLAVETQVRRVEQEGGAGAWKKLGRSLDSPVVAHK